MEDLPKTVQECDEEISELRVSVAVIRSDRETAIASRNAGDAFDNNWYHRSGRALGHLRTRLLEVGEQKKRLQRDAASAKRAANIAASKAAIDAANARRAERAATRDADQTITLRAVISHIRKNHPEIWPEVREICQQVRE
ncbi:hypothetical protein [Haematobacter massiliensis]|uniref:hypothetical protein n=1 Tax=Haematobacter massiliensis TaxID=195105 RepID=UPI001124D414|nr:hypothetical protein [Haematobacter massiliensis]